jgi:hypothetical protein
MDWLIGKKHGLLSDPLLEAYQPCRQRSGEYGKHRWEDQNHSDFVIEIEVQVRGIELMLPLSSTTTMMMRFSMFYKPQFCWKMFIDNDEIYPLHHEKKWQQKPKFRTRDQNVPIVHVHDLLEQALEHSYRQKPSNMMHFAKDYEFFLAASSSTIISTYHLLLKQL